MRMSGLMQRDEGLLYFIIYPCLAAIIGLLCAG